MRGRIYHTFVEFGACGGWRTEVDRTRRNRCPQGGTLKANTTWRERTKIQGMRRPKSRTIVMLELDSSALTRVNQRTVEYALALRGRPVPFRQSSRSSAGAGSHSTGSYLVVTVRASFETRSR